MLRSATVVVALVHGVLLAAAAHAAAPPIADLPRVEVRLVPELEQGELARIRATEVISGVAGRPGEALVSVPARIAFTTGQDYRSEDVRFVDDVGPLPVEMTIDDVPSGQPLQLRHFKPLRPTQGPITISYAARVAPAMSPRPRGPAYDLRSVQGGAGGAYFSFLLLPLSADQVDLRLSWDLSALPTGARALSTSETADMRGRVAWMQVYSTFFLVGNVQGQRRPDGLFQAYWIGTPPFDVAASTEWSATEFETLRRFFHSTSAGPYTMLMRPYARPRDGGGATQGGFMLEYGVGSLSDSSRRLMFTHEMVHHFIGTLDGDASAVAWFGEGLAEFYKIRLPLRIGTIDSSDIEREIGLMTAAYYNSPVIDVPYPELARRRWADDSAQLAPYSRGFVYFVDLNAKIRAKSAGRSLDDLVLKMLERRAAGQSYDEGAWRQLLVEELGPSGTADLDRMLNGQVVIPPDDAFGPCLKRTVLSHPRPVLGMSEDAFLVEPHRVVGLVAESNAARAGLRDGDVIDSFTGVTPRIAHSASNVVLSDTVRVSVRRDGRPMNFSFSTAGPRVTEYLWTSQPEVEGHCAF